jgi:hypothetical protein
VWWKLYGGTVETDETGREGEGCYRHISDILSVVHHAGESGGSSLRFKQAESMLSVSG